MSIADTFVAHGVSISHTSTHSNSCSQSLTASEIRKNALLCKEGVFSPLPFFSRLWRLRVKTGINFFAWGLREKKKNYVRLLAHASERANEPRWEQRDLCIRNVPGGSTYALAVAFCIAFGPWQNIEREKKCNEFPSDSYGHFLGPPFLTKRMQSSFLWMQLCNKKVEGGTDEINKKGILSRQLFSSDP